MLNRIHNPRISYVSRILALPIMALMVLAFTVKTKTIVTGQNLPRAMTVVIDAGHGKMDNGHFSGAMVDNVAEDAIVLSLAKKIQELNHDQNLRIVLTRSDDGIIDLHRRVDIAKENQADLFLSLHVNARVQGEDPKAYSNESSGSGFEVMVSNKMPPYQEQSEMFGSVLQRQLSSIYQTNPKLLKRQMGVWVIDQNACPSVLLECGFITDSKDRNFIMKSANQDLVAQKILAAIEQYGSAVSSDHSSSSQFANGKDQNDATSKRAKKDSTIENALVIVDGKEVGIMKDVKTKLNKYDVNTIESMNVLTGTPAIQKYGDKGKNGVIEIILKRANDKQRPDNTGNGAYKLQVHLNMTTDTVPRPQTVTQKLDKDASIDKQVWRDSVQKNLAEQDQSSSPATKKEIGASGSLPRLKADEARRLTKLVLDDCSRCTVTSFALSTDMDNGDVAVVRNKGAEFSNEAKALVAGLRAGKLLIIDQIQVVRDGQPAKAHSIVYDIWP